MKYKIICLLLLVGASFHSQAAILSFGPDQSVGLGDVASVDIRISQLGDEILTGFDLDISFDDSFLAFQSFTVPSPTTGLDPFGFDDGFFSYSIDFGFGTVGVGDLSLELDSTLFATQADSFVLGTLTFDALSLGTSGLDFSYALLAGAFVFDPDLGFEVPSEVLADLQSGSITVPEPGILLLFITGLLGMGMLRRIKAIPARKQLEF